MNYLKVFMKINSNPIKQLKYCPQITSLQRRFNANKAAANRTATEEEANEEDNRSDLKLDSLGKGSEDCLIYSGPQTMVKMIKTIKLFSISTTLIASGVQPFIFTQILATNSSAFAIGFASLTSAGIVLSPLLLNWFTKRYVTHLYYNYKTEVFRAWTLNLLNRRTSVEYKAQEVSVPEALGVFTTYTVGAKKKPYFVDPEFVTDFNAFKAMLGYDIPLDLKGDKIDAQNDSKTKL